MSTAGGRVPVCRPSREHCFRSAVSISVASRRKQPSQHWCLHFDRSNSSSSIRYNVDILCSVRSRPTPLCCCCRGVFPECIYCFRTAMTVPIAARRKQRSQHWCLHFDSSSSSSPRECNCERLQRMFITIGATKERRTQWRNRPVSYVFCTFC